MVSFKDLGLSNTKRMFKVAQERKFAVPGYNYSNLERKLIIERVRHLKIDVRSIIWQ